MFKLFLKLLLFIVESNDNLYGLDVKFLKEIDKISSIILGEILSYLKKIGACHKQTLIALDLFMRVVTRADLMNDGMKSLAINLWNLSLKHGYADAKYIVSLQ